MIIIDGILNHAVLNYKAWYRLFLISSAILIINMPKCGNRWCLPKLKWSLTVVIYRNDVTLAFKRKERVGIFSNARGAYALFTLRHHDNATYLSRIDWFFGA